jgi:hypothetical protein
MADTEMADTEMADTEMTGIPENRNKCSTNRTGQERVPVLFHTEAPEKEQNPRKLGFSKTSPVKAWSK